MENVTNKCHKLLKLFYAWSCPNHLPRDFVTWSSDVSKAAGSDIIKRLMQHNLLWHLARMITASCASFRSLRLYPGRTGKLLRHFSEKTEASHLFLTHIDLYIASFNNCVELRKATATNRREGGSSFNLCGSLMVTAFVFALNGSPSPSNDWSQGCVLEQVSLLSRYMYLSTV